MARRTLTILALVATVCTATTADASRLPSALRPLGTCFAQGSGPAFDVGDFDWSAFGQLFAGFDARFVEGDRFEEFRVDRAELGACASVEGVGGLLLGVETVRSAGPQSLFGIDGNSLVVRLKHAAAFTQPTLGPGALTVLVGLIPDPWVRTLDARYFTIVAGTEALKLGGARQHGLGGGGDSVRGYDGAGMVVDQTTWGDTEADTSWCRMPNGSGAFASCAAATFGAPNDAIIVPMVVLNEVESAGDDRIELFNPGSTAVDLAAWYVADSGNDPNDSMTADHRYDLPPVRRSRPEGTSCSSRTPITASGWAGPTPSRSTTRRAPSPTAWRGPTERPIRRTAASPTVRARSNRARRRRSAPRTNHPHRRRRRSWSTR